MFHFINTNSFYRDGEATGKSPFSPPFLSDFSSSIEFLETRFSDECMELPLNVDELHANALANEFLMDLDGFDLIVNDDIDANGIPNSWDETEEREQSFFSHHSQSDGSQEWSHDMQTSSLILPFEGMEVDNHLCLAHLLRAYVEAMDNQEFELSEAIAQRLILRVSPVGGVTERLLYYMFRHLNKELEYLTQESIKSFGVAFKAFFEIFPYGKFSHVVSNLAVLSALPKGAETIHMIVFDIGEGLQLASLMDAIRHQNVEVRVTSIKLSEDEETSPFIWRFEEAKERLCDHAKSHGLKFEVEQVRLQDLETRMRNTNIEDHGKKSWYVFNCNVGLPQMGGVRSKKDVLEFLRLAQNFLHAHHVTCWGTSKGIITYSDGDALHDHTTSYQLSHGSFLEANFAHYHALLESMESCFPKNLREARVALECLFVAPNASAAAWGRKWEVERQCGGVEFGVGLEGLEFSEASLVKAKELVEGVGLYGVRIEGEKNNAMVMEWNGIPMVRVCCWKS